MPSSAPRDPTVERALLGRHFVDAFYRQQCPGLSIGPDALEHFLTQGWLLGLDPSPLFRTCAYLICNPDVMAAAMNPLLHYLRYGEAEGRRLHLDTATNRQQDLIMGVIGPEFQADFYLRQIPELASTMVDPVLHYMVIGWRRNNDPSPDFSTNFYLARHADVRKSQQNPFHHYLTSGRLEGRLCSAAAVAGGSVPYSAAAQLIRDAVDVEFYFTKHRTLRDNHVDAVLHYLHFGWKLGYDPSVDFSTADYLRLNVDVLPQGQNPLYHYMREGRASGCIAKLPRQLAKIGDLDLLDGEIVRNYIRDSFNAQFYEQMHSDIVEGGIDPLQHYLSYGHLEGRDPAPWFSTEYYVRRYPAVRNMRINPLLHYLIWGKAKGFRTFASDAATPIEQNPQANHLVELDLGYLLLPPTPRLEMRDSIPNTKCLDIHWLIPDFDIGGGGHMTIFRMIKWLELFGHRCTIWVCHAGYDRTDTQRESILLRKYQIVRARVLTLDTPPSGTPAFPGADALIATSWNTAYLVRGANSAAERFYFVQDYEPFFYPTGARSLAAAATYDFGLACICASPWLEVQLRDRHGCWARSFPLCAADDYSLPAARQQNKVPRIAFYAREQTTRRAVELGLLALKLLAERGVSFHVDLFGGHRVPAELPFSASNWGIADPPILAQLYGAADIGVCFSATNYSLVPQEMMACGLPVLELDTPSTRAAFPDGVVALAGPDPFHIAETLERLLQDRDLRVTLAGRAATWLAGLSWERSARLVESALRERLGLPVDGSQSASAAATIRASVFIPTYNGGDLFRRVLTRVLEQRTNFQFNVVVVDSGSTDGTWEYLQSLSERVITKRIEQSSFQHGRTRNFGISLADGEYVALLTQDALPCDKFWLENFVVMLDRFPQAAGAFGRHVAHEESSAFVKRDMTRHFQCFEDNPLCVTKYTNADRYRNGDCDFHKMLHYYSDNNSCLRRSVWEHVPYPEVDFGEDQLWAERIIAHGYGKLYVSKACVYHSHDYTPAETLDRARVEAIFFREAFGYNVSDIDLTTTINRLNAEDEAWGSRNAVPAAEIERRKELNLHRLIGQAAAGG